MIATQDNTILIDFDTYTFHKGDKITLSYYNPFYINVDNAPDVQSILQTSESNTCGMVVVPKDTLLWNNQDFMFVTGTNGSTKFNQQNLPYNTADSTKLLTNVYETCFPHFGKKMYTNYMSLYPTSNTLGTITGAGWQSHVNPCFSSTTAVNSNICYTSKDYLYEAFWTFPLTKSITLYMSLLDRSTFTIPKSFGLIVYNSIDGNSDHKYSVTIQAGEYDTNTFHKSFLQSLSDTLAMKPYTEITLTNDHLISLRFIPQSDSLIFRQNDDFDQLYGRLHTFHTYPYIGLVNYLQYPTSLFPTVRSLHVPEGIYTADQLVNYINNNNVDTDGLPYTMFTAESNNNTIYIDADKPFIFNPEMTFHNDTTDLSTTFTTSHTLAVIPQQRETFNITFKNHTLGGNHTLQGTYSPAEFLRAVRDLTGCSFYINKFDNLDNVHGYISNILCDQEFDIDCSYFKFTNELTNGRYRVYNKVNLNRMNKQINITNTFLQSGINEYTPITQSSIFTIQPSNEMQNSGLLRIVNKDNNTVLTTAIDDHMYNCTHSCGISIYPYQYCSLSGRMLCTFSSAGDITYSCGSENYAYYAISSGTHTICVNSPCRPYNNLYVQGNVKCDFTEVSICANNVPYK